MTLRSFSELSLRGNVGEGELFNRELRRPRFHGLELRPR